MKKSNLFLLMLSLVFLPRILLSQTYDLRFIEELNNGSNFNVKVQIKTNSPFKLAASNITFNFNNLGLNNPTLLTAHNFSGVGGSPLTIYGAMTITNPLSNVVSVNIIFTQGDATFAGTVGTDWVDIVTIGFTTTNSILYSNLVFRSASPSPTVVYSCNGSGGTFTTALLAAGNWSTLDVPLPVELSSFTASSNQNAVNLKWQTATEVNNYGFEVERSVISNEEQNISWQKVGFVNGNGNSNSPKTYSFRDNNPSGGSKFLYRLKQIDNDGQFEYTDAVEVTITPMEYNLYQNYPNPFNPATKIKFALPEAGKVVLKIYDMTGAEVAELVNTNYEAGYYDIELNASNLASGVYLYRLQSNNFTSVKKLVVLK